jgi:transcriptional regulator with XRE-family HTH domain
MDLLNPDDLIPWREAFPEFSEDELIGKALTGARIKEGLTQTRLAELTGIMQQHLSLMEHGKRPIGKKNALLLGKVLKIDYRVFL